MTTLNIPEASALLGCPINLVNAAQSSSEHVDQAIEQAIIAALYPDHREILLIDNADHLHPDSVQLLHDFHQSGGQLLVDSPGARTLIIDRYVSGTTDTPGVTMLVSCDNPARFV